MTQKDHGELPEKRELGDQTEKTQAEEEPCHGRECSAAKSWPASLIFAGAVAGALGLLTFAPGRGGPAHWAWLAFTSGIALLISRTGRVSRWRAVFFVVLACGFMLKFKAGLLGITGSAFLAEDIQEVPYCHIALSSSILNTVYSQYLALKSGSWGAWGPLSLGGALWLVFTLALGTGWCSWVCWYGGIDDGCSRVLGRFRLRRLVLPPRLRDLPLAVLLFFAAVSMMSLKPEFCLWACPLKLTTGFLDPADAVRKAQLAVFATLAFLTLVAGPLVLGKRVFCGLVCPFGAWQSFFGRLNPFRVTVRRAACTRCGACQVCCPTFSIERDQASFPKVLAYCNRCGECVDACPTGAITYTVLDRLPSRLPPTPRLAAELLEARTLFLFCALVLGGAVGGLFVPDALRSAFSALLELG
ncbi:MAG: 4Fe-4S binding protein [Elusimicrobia bacterium]|nr:4Fe-4S binding protein [Elusimicrobiota bacterium]